MAIRNQMLLSRTPLLHSPTPPVIGAPAPFLHHQPLLVAAFAAIPKSAAMLFASKADAPWIRKPPLASQHQSTFILISQNVAHSCLRCPCFKRLVSLRLLILWQPGLRIAYQGPEVGSFCASSPVSSIPWAVLNAPPHYGT